MTVSPPKCITCIHFSGTGELTCKAFPEAIPYDIVTSQIEHTEVIDGQEGDYIYTKENK